MIVKINKKEYELHFGWDFIREANKINSMKIEGIDSGVGGIQLLGAGMRMNDPESLYKIIKCATSTEPQKPSNEDVETFIEKLLDEDKYVSFYDEVREEIKKHKFTANFMMD